MYRIRVRDNRRLGTLVRLFLLHDRVDLQRARDQLGDALVDDLIESNFAVADGCGLRPDVRIFPFRGLLILSDVRQRVPKSDFVPGVGLPSRILANLTPRSRVRRALDLCAGNGVQGLLATRHAAEVVATDVNPRAATYARGNAALNSAQMDVRCGDLLTPVADERFDLIVCNPPFVISPDTDYLFRDANYGDSLLSARLVQELPFFLTDGGTAIVLVSWVVRDDDVFAEPRGWLAKTTCDTVVLCTDLVEPLLTALHWNEDLLGDAPAAFGALERWYRHYVDLGARRIAYGAVALRRTGGRSPWQRREMALGQHSAGDSAASILFEAEDFLHRWHPGESAPGLRVRRGSLLERTTTFTGGTMHEAFRAWPGGNPALARPLTRDHAETLRSLAGPPANGAASNPGVALRALVGAGLLVAEDSASDS